MRIPARTIFVVLIALFIAVPCFGGSPYSIGLKFAAGLTDAQHTLGKTELLPTDIAGVPAVAQSHWNSLSNAVGSSSSLVDNTGAPSSLQVSWNTEGVITSTANGANFMTNSPPDNYLMGSYLNPRNVLTGLVSFVNIPAALTSGPGGFDLYIYNVGDTAGRGGSYLIVDSTGKALTGYKLLVEASAPTNYVENPGTTQTAMTGTYSVFRGLTNSSFTVQATGAIFPLGDSARAPMNAMQLVAESSAGEPAAATALIISTTNGTGAYGISWKTNEGTTGSLVLIRGVRAPTAKPVDGTTYNANPAFGLGDNLGDDNIGQGAYAVYAGPGTNVVVTGVTPLTTNFVTVFAYNGSGGFNPNYTLATQPITNAIAPAVLLSITNQLPTTLQTNGTWQSLVLAQIDLGGTINVTANSFYTSAAPAVITVNRTTGLITVNSGTTNIAGGSNYIWTTASSAGTTRVTTNFISLIGPPTPVLIHRYSFTSDASDSVGGANGVLRGNATVTGGQLSLDSSPGSYLNLNAVQDLQNYNAITWELWVTDQGTATWGRMFDFGNSTGTSGVQYMMLAPASATTLRCSYTTNYAVSGEQQITWSSRPALGAKTHIVVTTDLGTRRGVMYANGVPVATNTALTWSPQMVGFATNNALGQSQFSADPYFLGSIDEFRIWQYAMQPFQVGVDYAAGPNNVPAADIGNPTSLTLKIGNNPAGLGNRQQVAVTGNFASVSGVPMTTSGLLTYSSSNLGVATIDANGNVIAVGAGSTTLSASYAGVTGSAVLNVSVKPITLRHRYSFTETSGSTFADSMGGSAYTASFEPGFAGTMNGGSVYLDGVGSYVVMPAGLITNMENVSIEAWSTLDPNNAPNANGRLFTIGSAQTANEICGRPSSGTADGSASARFYGAGQAPSVAVNGDLSGLGAMHWVAVFDPNAGHIDVYHNGVFRNTVTNFFTPLSTIIDARGVLGANQPFSIFQAVTFDEFRITEGALSRSAIAASYAAGPNSTTNVVLARSAPSSVSLRVDPIMQTTERQLPNTAATYAGLAKPVVLSGMQEAVIYASDNPAVVRVNTNNLRASQPLVWTNAMFEAVGSGVAHVTATVAGVTSAPQTITVIAPQTMLMHRYSFNESAANPANGLLAHDSVGVQDGLVWGIHSAFSGTKLTLTPDLSIYTNDKNQFVEMPAGLVSSYDAVSLDVWFTAGVTGGGLNRSPSRLYDLGYQNSAGGAGPGYLYTAVRNGNGFGQITGSDAGTDVNAVLGISLDTNTWHLTVVYDQPGTGSIRVYTNGVLATSATIPSARQIPRNINDIHNYLAHSQNNGDAAFAGSFDEFRIYAGALSASQVAAIQSAGPNSVPSLPPRLSVTPAGANWVFSWPTTSGFTLKRSAAGLIPLSGYTPVGGETVNGSLTTVTIPAPAAITFFILSNP